MTAGTDTSWARASSETVPTPPNTITESSDSRDGVISATVVLTADRPWEGREVLIAGTVRNEGGTFRMWYQNHTDLTNLNLYAESDDGNWAPLDTSTTTHTKV